MSLLDPAERTRTRRARNRPSCWPRPRLSRSTLFEASWRDFRLRRSVDAAGARSPLALSHRDRQRGRATVPRGHARRLCPRRADARRADARGTARSGAASRGLCRLVARRRARCRDHARRQGAGPAAAPIRADPRRAVGSGRASRGGQRQFHARHDSSPARRRRHAYFEGGILNFVFGEMWMRARTRSALAPLDDAGRRRGFLIRARRSARTSMRPWRAATRRARRCRNSSCNTPSTPAGRRHRSCRAWCSRWRNASPRVFPTELSQESRMPTASEHERQGRARDRRRLRPGPRHGARTGARRRRCVHRRCECRGSRGDGAAACAHSAYRRIVHADRSVRTRENCRGRGRCGGRSVRPTRCALQCRRHHRLAPMRTRWRAADWEQDARRQSERAVLSDPGGDSASARNATARSSTSPPPRPSSARPMPPPIAPPRPASPT